MIWLALGICWIVSMFGSFSLSRSADQADEAIQQAVQENNRAQSVAACAENGVAFPPNPTCDPEEVESVSSA